MLYRFILKDKISSNNTLKSIELDFNVGIFSFVDIVIYLDDEILNQMYQCCLYEGIYLKRNIMVKLIDDKLSISTINLGGDEMILSSSNKSNSSKLMIFIDYIRQEYLKSNDILGSY